MDYSAVTSGAEPEEYRARVTETEIVKRGLDSPVSLTFSRIYETLTASYSATSYGGAEDLPRDSYLDYLLGKTMTCSLYVESVRSRFWVDRFAGIDIEYRESGLVNGLTPFEWLSGIDAKGRPVVRNERALQD